MKPHQCYRICARRSLIMTLSLLACFSVSAQTFTYIFKNAVNEYNAGSTGLAVGSVWLYSKIDAGAATDAVVTISNATGGISLFEFDQDNTTNGGFVEAFQPGINVPSGATVNGYVEFTFTFIKTGTYNTTTKTGTPLLQTNTIPATVLDDDGTTTGGTLYEYDVLNLGAASLLDYSTTGAQLSYSTSGNFVTGRNVTGTNYSGISSTATDVMFTVLNQNISSMVYRTGVISNFATTPAGRVTSLVFFLPTYPSAVLAISPLSNFKGIEKNNTISLQWQLANEDNLASLSLERSVEGGAFQSIKDFAANSSAAYNKVSEDPAFFSYSDQALPPQATIAYRVKMTTVSGEIQYSNVLDFTTGGGSQEVFRIYPTLITSVATLAISSETTGTGTFRIADYTGRIVYQQPVYLSKGINNLPIIRPAGLPPGNYVALVQTGERKCVQKILLGAQ